MGNFGGRPATRATCEASLKLDLAAPAIRMALHPFANTTGTWRWSMNGEPVAAIAYVWASKQAQLTLRYTCNGTPVMQTIGLVRTKPHFGGARYWFVCPFADTRVCALYLPSGARLWGGRAAHGLAYQSQRDGGWERFALQWLTRAGSPLAHAALQDRALLGLVDDRKWERRRENRQRRNQVRCIARRQRKRS